MDTTRTYVAERPPVDNPANIPANTTTVWLLVAALLSLIATLPAANRAMAQEVCVECSGPDTRYRCSIRDFEKIAKYQASSKVLEYVCITELARAGGHASCRAGNSFQGPCIGQSRQLDPATVGELPPEPAAKASVAGAEPRNPSNDPAAQPPAKNQAGRDSPQTLEELARRNKLDMSGVKDGLNTAGKAVGGAVKSSWRCLSSLFSDC